MFSFRKIQDIYLWLVNIVVLLVYVFVIFKFLWFKSFSLGQLLLTLVTLICIYLVPLAHSQITKNTYKDTRKKGFRSPYAVLVGVLMGFLLLMAFTFASFIASRYVILNKESNTVIRVVNFNRSFKEFATTDFFSTYPYLLENERFCFDLKEKTKDLKPSLRLKSVCYTLMDDSLIGLSKNDIDGIAQNSKNLPELVDKEITIEKQDNQLLLKLPHVINNYYALSHVNYQP